jgi:ABC transporter substrate binding protein
MALRPYRLEFKPHRLEFIFGMVLAMAALLGAAVAWSRPVIGQSPSKVYRVGLLSAGAPIADNSFQGAALIRGFTQRGYKLGRNLAFERRGAEGHIDRLPRLVDELAASKVDVIVTFGYPPALACKQATTLPVVVVLVDPVGTGLAESLARPGANLTGISDVSAEVTPKRMALLKEVAPQLRRVAMLWNANDLGGARLLPAEKTTPPRGMVSALSCELKTCTPVHRSAWLLAIFRRKLRVAILLLVVGVTPTGNRDAGKFAG